MFVQQTDAPRCRPEGTTHLPPAALLEPRQFENKTLKNRQMTLKKQIIPKCSQGNSDGGISVPSSSRSPQSIVSSSFTFITSPLPSIQGVTNCSRSVEGALGLQQQVSLQARRKGQLRHAAVTAPPQATADGAAAKVHQAAGGGGTDGEERVVEVGVTLRRRNE